MDRALGQHWIHFHATFNLWAFNTAVNIWFTNLITYAKKINVYVCYCFFGWWYHVMCETHQISEPVKNVAHFYFRLQLKLYDRMNHVTVVFLASPSVFVASPIGGGQTQMVNSHFDGKNWLWIENVNANQRWNWSSLCKLIISLSNLIFSEKLKKQLSRAQITTIVADNSI